MSLPPDLCVGVTVKYLQAVSDLLLVVFGRAVTHVVHDLIPDGVVLVLCQLENTSPEVRMVFPYAAWAHLLGSLQPYRGVLVPGQLNDLLNVGALLNLGQSLANTLSLGTLRLLIRVDL